MTKEDIQPDPSVEDHWDGPYDRWFPSNRYPQMTIQEAYGEGVMYRADGKHPHMGILASILSEHPLWAWRALNSWPDDALRGNRTRLHRTVSQNKSLVEKFKTVDEEYAELWIEFYDTEGDGLLNFPNEDFARIYSVHKSVSFGRGLIYETFEAYKKNVLETWLDSIQEISEANPDYLTHWLDFSYVFGADVVLQLSTAEAIAAAEAKQIVSPAGRYPEFMDSMESSMNNGTIIQWSKKITDRYRSISGVENKLFIDLMQAKSLDFMLDISSSDFNAVSTAFRFVKGADQHQEFLVGFSQLSPGRVRGWAEHIIDHYRQDSIGGAQAIRRVA